MFVRLCLIVLGCAGLCTPAAAERYLVRTQPEYFAAAEKVVAGDVIVLANGSWKDFEIVLTGTGTAEKPITLIAESPGKVEVTGQSNLRIGGEHILVSGLVFIDGYSPTGEVISFRRSKDDLAHNSRVTEVVVDGFSKPDRYESDYWVGMYGKNNRFDHSFLANKTNKGVTLAVRLDTGASRENGHRIDHNYFGKRPVLGSNGGETIRIGTSHYSMFESKTLIADNYFENCDGEVEIISIKSGGNVVRGNVFDASQGTVTLRHGDGNLVERNVFFGRGKDHTGGIRVINADQTVRDNYMEGLRGTGFASALTVMNGVPDSPVNRYIQVTNARIEHNSILDSKRITFAAGSDAERTAVPVDSRFTGNLLSGVNGGTFIEVDDDISGISLTDNHLLAGTVHGALAARLKPRPIELVRAANGLLYPNDPALTAGVPRDLAPVARDETGPAWYPKPSASTAETARSIAVLPGEGTIEAALANASGETTLELAPGEYIVNKALLVDRPLKLVGPTGKAGRASITFTRPTLFEMVTGGRLALQDLAISGREAPDNVGNSIIRTSTAPIRGNLAIDLLRVSISELTVNRGFDVIVIGKNAFVDAITIADSSFSSISGRVIKANAETDDYGQYGAEYVTINGTTFTDIASGIADIYRGGRDESTFGPHFALADSTVVRAGGASTPALLLHGVQDTRITGNDFVKSSPLRIVHTVGTPRTAITGNRFDRANPVQVEELEHSGPPRAVVGDNQIKEASA